MTGSASDRTAVVIGGTSGLGNALAIELAERGWAVLATGSTRESAEGAAGALVRSAVSDRIHFIPLPLDEPAALLAPLESELESRPPMELLVWVAGTMPSEVSWPEMRESALASVSVNLTSAAVVLAWAAERLETRGRGRIAAVGSVAGDRGRKGAPVYGATKAGLHALCDGLRHRLHGSGVGVTSIRPGWIETRMLPLRLHGHPLAVDPRRAARTIARGLERGRDVLYVGWWWRWVGWVLRAMPATIHKRFAPE